MASGRDLDIRIQFYSGIILKFHLIKGVGLNG